MDSRPVYAGPLAVATTGRLSTATSQPGDMTFRRSSNPNPK